MRHIPPALRQLAAMLALRKQAVEQANPLSRPYHLLLTSSLSLTPTVLKSICGASNWSSFYQHMRNLGPDDRILSLSPLQYASSSDEGYKALARLTIKGYFSTILTTNIDSRLERALEDVLAEEQPHSRAFKVLIVDRDKDEYIASQLQERGKDICIVKLYGSLQEGAVPATFPLFCELRSSIVDTIRHFLRQDVLIIGSIKHDDDINRAFSGDSKGSIYYVLPHSLPRNDDVIRLIQARHGEYKPFVITGSFGQPDTFFPVLEALLLTEAASALERSSQQPTVVFRPHEHLPSVQEDVRMPSMKVDHSGQPPLRVFCAYAHEDKALFEQFKKALGILIRLKQITIWDDDELIPGTEWQEEIKQQLHNADIILLLLSPSFIASEYCWNEETQWALNRHTIGEAKVIPILLRPTPGWESLPLGKLHVLPTGAKPIITWDNLDKAFEDVVSELSRTIQHIRQGYYKE